MRRVPGAEVRVGAGVGEEFMFRIAGSTAGKAIGERFGDWGAG